MLNLEKSILLEDGSDTLEKSGFFSIMEPWQRWESDGMSAIHSCRKAVDAAPAGMITKEGEDGICPLRSGEPDIHYAMAVKNNLYDALEYAGQVEEAAKSHRKEMRRKKEQGELPAEEGRKNQAQVKS